uniref:Uncharacterized protein n=1 Tax=Arundo donax TaxID=35708 RepID=A0A0A9GAU9_ARUDO
MMRMSSCLFWSKRVCTMLNKLLANSDICSLQDTNSLRYISITTFAKPYCSVLSSL